MSAGDFVRRANRTNSDVYPTAGSDLALLWPTAVASQGSGITYNATTGTFTLGETGKFLVLFSDYCYTASTATNERINVKLTLTLGGTELQEGYTSAYLRKQSGHQYLYQSGFAIIDVASTTGTADELQVRAERIDDSTTGSPDRATGDDSAGIYILKLDDNLSYARYESTSVTSPTVDDTAVQMDLTTTLEESGPFTRTGSTIDIATTNLVLAVYTMKSESMVSGAVRQEYQARLNLAGSAVHGSYTQCYIRGSDNCFWGGASGMSLLSPSSGDDLKLEIIAREAGQEDFTASLQLVELPATAKAIIIEATTGDANASATDFVWDTAPRNSDTDVFTHTAGTAGVTLDVAGDYIFGTGLADDTDAGGGTSVQRAAPSIGTILNSTVWVDCASSSYCRGTGTADHFAHQTGGMVTGASASDVLEVVTFVGSDTTDVRTVSSGGFFIIQASSIIATGPVISNAGDEDYRDGETGIVVTGVNFEADGANSKIEIGSHSTYTASTTKITQTDTSWADTSITFTAVLSTLTPGLNYLYVTNHTSGETNESGYAIYIHRKVAFTLAGTTANNMTGEQDITSGIEELTGGTGTFTTGRSTTNSNPLTTIDIISDGRTEVAFALKATTDAIDAGVYEFKIVKSDNSVLDIYPTTLPRWTIGGGGGGAAPRFKHDRFKHLLVR